MCVCVCVCVCVCFEKIKKTIKKLFFVFVFFNEFILEIFVLYSRSTLVAYNTMGLYFRSCWTIFSIKSFMFVLWGVFCFVFCFVDM